MGCKSVHMCVYMGLASLATSPLHLAGAARTHDQPGREGLVG